MYSDVVKIRFAFTHLKRFGRRDDRHADGHIFAQTQPQLLNLFLPSSKHCHQS